MNKIYIFGHKKPDTDSVTSAISLSYLKNKMGYNTVPRILGNPNNETKFVLNYFHIDEPKYLNDVKLKVEDLNYMKHCSIYFDDTIYSAFDFMNQNSIGSIPIVDYDDSFMGLISLKDIAKHQITDEIDVICTSYTNIINTLNAKELLKYDEKICGKVIVTSYSSTTFIENAKIGNDTILIVGDRHSIIEYAIRKKVKMIILTKNSNITDNLLTLAKENHINIIASNESAFDTTRKIWLSNFVNSIAINDVITVQNDEDVDDFINLAKKNKYSNYPVITKNNKCKGILRLSDVSDSNRKKVILVDHNESQQSVDGLNEAELLEIIDHHKLGNINTSLPINFRNMPVGSTNTIIYMMYKESKVDIPKDIAGLMLSGIISDTLLFRSPTTTTYDKVAVKQLSKIAGLNYEEYGFKMLKAGSSIEGKTLEEILYSDYKNFTVDNSKIGIGQVLTLDIDDIMKDKDSFVELVNKVANQNDYYLVSLFITDIINDGSYIIYNEKATDLIKDCFNISDLKEGYFIKNCISRKKQIIPNIISTLEKKI